MRTTLRLTLAAALFALSAVAASAQSDSLIVPGQRIGAVARGITAAELYKIMGNPQKSRAMEDFVVYEFELLQVITRADRVVGIHTSGPTYATREGLHVGSSVLEVRAKRRSPDLAGHYLCYNAGIAFHVNEAVVVTGIDVHSPGCR